MACWESFLTKEEEWNLLQHLLHNECSLQWKEKLTGKCCLHLQQNIQLINVELIDADNVCNSSVNFYILLPFFLQKDVEIQTEENFKTICILLHNYIRKELNCFIMEEPVVPFSISPGSAIYFEGKCVLADCVACKCTLSIIPSRNDKTTNVEQLSSLQDALDWFEKLDSNSLASISIYSPVLQTHWQSTIEKYNKELLLLHVIQQISILHSVNPIPIVLSKQDISWIEEYLYSKLPQKHFQRKEMIFFVETSLPKTKNLVTNDSTKTPQELIQIEREYQHRFFLSNVQNMEIEIEVDAKDVLRYGEFIAKYEYTVGEKFHTGTLYRAQVILFYPAALLESLEASKFDGISIQESHKRVLDPTSSEEPNSKKQKL